MSGVRHLYVHLPFCSHRCGYCDFVTVVGRRGQHEAYVDALLCELEREAGVLAAPLDTIFIGGGTPTFTEQLPLGRLLRSCPLPPRSRSRRILETVTSEGPSFCHETVSIVSPSAHNRSTPPFWTCSSGVPAPLTSAAQSPSERCWFRQHLPRSHLRGFQARAPPTSSGTSRRPWRSLPSTCVLRARGEARNALHARERGPTRTAPRPWSATSSTSSRR